MAVREVILDVDTGVDDALALLFAVRHPDLNLRAVSCVDGNVGVDRVVANTLAVLDCAGAGAVPVGRGAVRPLVAERRDARTVHGADGLGDTDLPASQRSVAAGGAIGMLRERILDSPAPVTLVGLGPLTNLALLLRTYPEVVSNVERLLFVGGSTGTGNATALAEFNVWHDPEAAAIVLHPDGSDRMPVMMYGLDVFYAPAVGASTYDAMRHQADPGARLAGRLLAHSHHVARSDPRVPDGGLLGDAGLLCALVDDSRLVTEPLRVQVALAGECRGQTVVDLRRVPGEAEEHGLAGSAGRRVDVALTTNGDHYCDMYVETVCGDRP